VEQAVLKGLGKSDVIIWCNHNMHQFLNYADIDRWEKDASFLDTDWVGTQNENLEDAFIREVHGRYPADTSAEDLAEAVRENGKSRRLRCQKQIRETLTKAVIDHLHYHPTLRHRPGTGPEIFDNEAIWREQCIEMNDLCREHGQSWAWEYLWKNWYCWAQWRNWARAIHPIMPIIESNAAVESLWAIVKRDYLKRHPRPSLEFLGEILMHHYLPNRRRFIFALRQRTASPPGYSGMVNVWRGAIRTIIEERDNAEEPEVLFNRQQTLYHTDLEHWWCGCAAYKRRYHICKHLVRFYYLTRPVDIENPWPIPFFGDVWRQGARPFLWIAGLHEPQQLHVKTSDDRWEPWFQETRDGDLEGANPGIADLDPQLDEDPGQDELLGESDMDNAESDSEIAGTQAVMNDVDMGIQGDHDGSEVDAAEYFYSRDLGERIAIVERAKRGEERQEALRRAKTFFENMIGGINDLLQYDPEHPHVQELPANGPRHLKSMVDWELKRQELLRARISRTTITERRGHVFT
jgi:hypothetical protein